MMALCHPTTYKELLGQPTKQLGIAFWSIALLGDQIDLKAGFLELMIRNSRLLMIDHQSKRVFIHVQRSSPVGSWP